MQGRVPPQKNTHQITMTENKQWRDNTTDPPTQQDADFQGNVYVLSGDTISKTRWEGVHATPGRWTVTPLRQEQDDLIVPPDSDETDAKVEEIKAAMAKLLIDLKEFGAAIGWRTRG